MVLKDRARLEKRLNFNLADSIWLSFFEELQGNCELKNKQRQQRYLLADFHMHNIIFR